MLGNLYRMVRFGPALYQSARRLKVGRLAALVIVAGAGCGGAPFSAGSPYAEGAIDAGDADVADVLEPNDGPFSCNPDKGFFPCGPGSSISIGDICELQTDGNQLETARTPAECGCAPTCACVLPLINPCMADTVPEYPVGCEVKNGNMYITCSPQ
jgi:hypothetical protein